MTIEWITENGEAATLARKLDWSKTCLGPVEGWPDSLRSTVNLVLACSFPMVLLWGEELVQIYNDAYAAIMGKKHPAGMGLPTREVWPEVWEFNEPVYRRVLEGETLTFENQLFPITRQGFREDAYFTLCYSPLRDGANTVAGVLVTVFETTPQIRAEAAHLATERSLRNMIESTPQISWAADPSGNFVDFSERWLQITGMNRAEALESGWQKVVHPEDLERMEASWRHSLKAGEPYDMMHRMRTASGGYCWMRTRAHAFHNAIGNIDKWYGTTENIDERKRAEESLRLSEERLRLAQEAGRVACWEWDVMTGKFIWSGGSEWVYGRSPEEMTHIDQIAPHLHEDDCEFIMKSLQPVIEGSKELNSEFRVYWPDGSVHWISGRGKPVLSPEGKTLRIVGTNIDVTERKLAEAALLQVEKLAAVGRLATSIAHEINNPLESVTNLLYLARSATELAPQTQEYLDVAERELRRVSVISNQTLRFHKQSSNPTAVTWDDLVGSVLSINQGRLVNSKIQIERRDRTYKQVLCFEGEIRQVLNNLVGNAIDAMRPVGGRLLLRSRETTDVQSGERGLALTIADAGHGMSREVLDKIFQPFFTTKGMSGTGLGLWVSQEIVNRHRGRLRVRSSQRTEHTGTVFVLFLPFHAATR